MLDIPDEKTKRLLDLADFIEQLPAHLYDQRIYGNPGPDEPKCLCGWINERLGEGTDLSNYFRAARHLSLGNHEVQQLFNGYPRPGETVTTKLAARVLRHYAITGELNWYLRDPGKKRLLHSYTMLNDVYLDAEDILDLTAAEEREVELASG